MRYNDLSIEILDHAGNTLPDLRQVLSQRRDLVFETFYPGGTYGAASFVLPAPATQLEYIQGGMQVRIWNGLYIAYDGYIDRITTVGNAARIECSGAWGYILGRRYTRRRWADKRMTGDIWAVDEQDSAALEKATPDYYNRLAITPKAVSWSNTEGFNFIYTAPGTEKVKRITGNYELQEGAQVWILACYSSDDRTTISLDSNIATASGTGTFDITLATARKYVYLTMYAGATQTPAADGSIIGVFSDLTVYAELDASDTEGTFNLDVLSRDVIAALSGTLYATAPFSSSNTYSLVPFVANGDLETYASALLRAGNYGDSNQAPWVAYCVSGASANTNLPVLLWQTQAQLINFDVSIDAASIFGGLARAFDEVWNYIHVTYTDYDGRQQTLSPDDDANLKDDTSIDLYGQREYLLNIKGQASSAEALNLGQRFLSYRKEALWVLDQPVTLTGAAQGASGELVPVANIFAGQRLQITDFVQSPTARPFRAIIQRTRYDDVNETLQVWLSQPDPLAVQIARLERR